MGRVITVTMDGASLCFMRLLEATDMSILNKASRLSSPGPLEFESPDIGTSGIITSIGSSSPAGATGGGACIGGSWLAGGGSGGGGSSPDSAGAGAVSGEIAALASASGRVWAKTLPNPPVTSQTSESSPDISNSPHGPGARKQTLDKARFGPGSAARKSRSGNNIGPRCHPLNPAVAHAESAGENRIRRSESADLSYPRTWSCLMLFGGS